MSNEDGTADAGGGGAALRGVHGRGETIFVNDRPVELSGGETLSTLARDIGIAERKGVAVAVNGSVVPRAEWAGRALAPQDRVLVIRATQGG